MYIRLPFDEINAFFSDEPEDWDDIAEDDLYVIGKWYMISKNVPKVIEHFEHASQMGNCYSDYQLAKIYLYEDDFYDIKGAIYYLENSASGGNIYAYHALFRLSENIIVALTTDIAYIISGIAELFQDRQHIEDFTTLPHHREKKKHGHKQSM